MTRESNVTLRRMLVVVLVAMLAFVAGVLLVRAKGDTSSATDRVERQPAASPRSVFHADALGPVGAAPLVPVGFDSGERGAVAGAVAYATASQRWLYFTDDEIQAAISEIATPAAAPRLASDVVTDISMARDQLRKSSGRIWWLVRPLAWRVDDFRDGEARVSVWTVTILSAAGVAAPQSEFVTVTLDLAWVDNDWRVDGVRDTPGPTPITGPHDQPWDAEPFDQTLDGFTRVGGEPRS